MNRDTEKPPSMKRPHQIVSTEATETGLTDRDLRAVRQRLQNDNELDDAPSQLLACPFFRHDRYKYFSCTGFQLRRVKDVKQHIYRKHSKPEFYCSRCFQIFESGVSRDFHTRRADCYKRPDPQYDGISLEQKKMLSFCSKGRKTREEQWYGVWDALFPSAGRPKSVYIGDFLEETVPLLRAFWNIRRAEIMHRVLEARNGDGVDITLVEDIIGTTFDQLEEEASAISSPAESKGLSRETYNRQSTMAPAIDRESLPENGTTQGVLDSGVVNTNVPSPSFLPPDCDGEHYRDLSCDGHSHQSWSLYEAASFFDEFLSEFPGN